MRKVIVNVNLEYVFPKANSNEESDGLVQEVELPKEYVSNSFEIVKFLDENDQYTVFSAIRKEAKRFSTKEEAEAKLVSLSQTQDTIRIVSVSFPEIRERRGS